jgi:hypothetical protein
MESPAQCSFSILQWEDEEGCPKEEAIFQMILGELVIYNKMEKWD